MKKPFSLRGCLLAAITLTTFCAASWAQGNIRTVLFVRVKMGQEDSWKAAVKDYAALVKKAGSDQGFTVWESQSDRRNTRSSGTPLSGSNWVSRIRNCSPSRPTWQGCLPGWTQ